MVLGESGGREDFLAVVEEDSIKFRAGCGLEFRYRYGEILLVLFALSMTK